MWLITARTSHSVHGVGFPSWPGLTRSTTSLVRSSTCSNVSTTSISLPPWGSGFSSRSRPSSGGREPNVRPRHGDSMGRAIPDWNRDDQSQSDPAHPDRPGLRPYTPRMGVRQLVNDERADLVAFLRTLTRDEWEAPSLCAGWRVRDVVAHVPYDGTPLPRYLLDWARVGF